MNDDELNRALALFRESGRAWSEHWMNRPAMRTKRTAPSPRLRWAVLVAATVIPAAILLQPTPRTVAPAQPFVPIPFVAPLAPYERIAVTRMEVPVAALAAAGFDIPALEPGSSVQADILIGQDGRAHAIRLLRRSNDR